MSKAKFNQKILKVIREITSEDKEVGSFLIDILLEETKNPSWWKDKYLNQVKTHSANWGNDDAN